jgi:hypothetical protein
VTEFNPLQDVADEALHDWLDERPPRDQPDPAEYREDAERWLDESDVYDSSYGREHE